MKTSTTLPTDPHDGPGPDIKTSIPGPLSQAWVDDLARYECPAITARRARRTQDTGVDQDPVVWERAQGSNVWDVDGNRYVDYVCTWGPALLGHGREEVVEAVCAAARDGLSFGACAAAEGVFAERICAWCTANFPCGCINSQTIRRACCCIGDYITCTRICFCVGKIV